jgi:hypothetical protein
MESQATKQSEALQRFQGLLKELFEFECADLDFGIYRIRNHKREVIRDRRAIIHHRVSYPLWRPSRENPTRPT